MTPSPPQLSLVVPAYNESLRIQEPLRRIAAFLATLPLSSELLVVDDGSQDGTTECVQAIAAELPVPVRCLRYAPNRGKGHALKVGFGHARGDVIAFSDADLSTPIEELPKLLAELERGYDLAIGSRKMPGANVSLRQPYLRESLGRIFTRLSRILVTDVSDVTCGFKAYRGEVGRDLYAHLRLEDWSFDAEILRIARSRGHRIAEIPVRWQDVPGTKVSLLSDGLRAGLGLLRIRWNELRGYYRSPLPSTLGVQVWDAAAEAQAEPAVLAGTASLESAN